MCCTHSLTAQCSPRLHSLLTEAAFAAQYSLLTAHCSLLTEAIYTGHCSLLTNCTHDGCTWNQKISWRAYLIRMAHSRFPKKHSQCMRNVLLILLHHPARDKDTLTDTVKPSQQPRLLFLLHHPANFCSDARQIQTSCPQASCCKQPGSSWCSYVCSRVQFVLLMGFRSVLIVYRSFSK